MARAKSYHVERFDVLIDIQENGSIVSIIRPDLGTTIAPLLLTPNFLSLILLVVLLEISLQWLHEESFGIL